MMNVSSNITIFILLLAVLAASAFFYLRIDLDNMENREKKNEIVINGNWYDLDNPIQKFILPKELEEISDLAYYKGNQIICVQDENGIIYFFDLLSGEIVRTENFGKDDDYEGVEYHNGVAYVLNSSGQISTFTLSDNDIGTTKIINTPLSSKNDCEGLSYDAATSSLLISTKERGKTENFDVKENIIYSLNIKDHHFAPKLRVEEKPVKEFLEQLSHHKKHFPFKPSAIYYDNPSKKTLVLCSVGNLLLIYNQLGELENLAALDPDLYRQPEGILLLPDKSLLISSEGDGKDGYILKFNPRQK